MMMPYSAYKDSKLDWLGKIPSHWDLVKLGACFKERNEKVSDKDFAALSVTKNGILPQMEHVAKTDAGDNRKKVCIGDFVINSRSDRKGSSGTSDYDGSVSLISIILEPRLYEPRFAHHLLRSYNFQEEFYKYGKGIVADLWSTRYSDMKNIFVPLMPIAEQKAIAKFLDRETQRIDSLIEEKQTFIKLLKEKRQALISHVVTKGLNPNVEMQDSGIEWIGQVPKHWSVVQLKRLIDSIEQGWSPECLATPAKNERWGVLKSGAVNGGVYSQDENKELPETLSPRPEIEVKVGDLIMSRASGSRELIGSAAYVYATRERLMLSDKLFRLHCKEDVDAEFVAIALGSFPLRRQIELAIGGAEGLANNLSQANIKKLLIPKPPKTEQEAITSHIKSVSSKIEDLIIETNNSIALLKERKTSLISAAVTGKIDVRETV
ncbi:restriction modification system DNA specificity domain-containing protein [Shewanella carassii]|uniref:restriction endonuclease subunit S n=1 Tax=Shewanella carassii TaxID=1987584 RepID=UPI001BED8191|nr:restriction endonuclease subunit S [Shewanella carassii]BCV67286.1 restriction modification system DNA specificity domain-containing protein [Shewanella carassii]